MKDDAKPFDMVVIGGTGDLTRRKLLPALYYLHQLEALPSPGRILAAARPRLDRQRFLDDFAADSRQHIDPGEITDRSWNAFTERLEYISLDATDAASFGPLAELLAAEEGRERMFYLATPPRLYIAISRALAQAGLLDSRSRIVLEKPIGHDLASAQDINRGVGEFFSEEQIFRIDHYLGKETVQNLMALRFGNALFEPLWRAEHIDHVQITVAEQVGVEGRGGYYDRAGALRDMVQNHILQLLCLVAMEPPTRLTPDALRAEKIKVLRALRPIAGDDVARKTVRGQYRRGASAGEAVVAYSEEPKVPADSKTETYLALQAEIDNWRWAGVPFYLRTGKRMVHRLSEIVIQFKRVPHLMFDGLGNIEHDNRLVIRLQPDETIKLAVMMKTPGSGMDLKRVHLDLDLKEEFAGRTPGAYERLLMDIIRGNPALFMHREEVEEAWRWCEPILAGWRERDDLPIPYPAGSWGPSRSMKLFSHDHHDWYENILGGYF